MRAREQLNQAGQGLCEGDVVTRINNSPVTDAMTLKEARKLIESCKDRLNLVVTRELIREETVTNGNYQNNYNSLGELTNNLITHTAALQTTRSTGRVMIRSLISIILWEVNDFRGNNIRLIYFLDTMRS